MLVDNKILVGKGENPVYLLPKMANRHGLIAGATGTGKTVTLKVIAESFSEMGVPVFLADIKGDVSGMCKSGESNENIEKRLSKLEIENFNFHAFPTEFWDVFGESGHPVRTTISDMGPVLLGRLMNLTDVQCGVLNIVFRIADDKGLLLLDMKDLRLMLQYVGEHNKEFTTSYGNVSQQSIGAIQRAMLTLEDAGGNKFFGEPDLQISDWMRTDEKGRGYINILHCVKLFQQPLLYSTFMLWMLNELYENLPEVGDLAKPKIVFFFDEAHLLFSDPQKALLEKIVQVVKLIRSKGVGVYFITQNPADIPDNVLAQLGNRIQHALRAYTPAEQKAIKAAAESFRVNPVFKTEDAITELSTGEALVSFLDEDGKPSIVERAKILPPMSFMSAIDDDRREKVIMSSDLYGKYEKSVDRESAYEVITEQNAQEEKKIAVAKEKETQEKEIQLQEKERIAKEKEIARQEREEERRYNSNRRQSSYSGRRSTSTFEKVTNSAMNTIGREIGRSLVRSIFGILKK